ncbi:hypothetical protein [Rhodonellum sp.]|uniref:hypothetical protein n=1 Tax=Rhodonellum sp. TaxID=2231180 RepID=UPI00271FDB7E|nr:hypothetical protein [Rhodonellum sp.]MDO9554501.1 hypothetical protein [Rhodonellum sp.]
MLDFPNLKLLIVLFFVFSCSSSQDKKAIALIEKSIEAHGGQESWGNIRIFSFEKETRLYLENGEIETHTVQQQEFRFKPYFEAKMTWGKDSIIHKVIFDGLKTQYWMGKNEIQNEGFLQAKKKDLDAAYYVLTKPFDLLDEGKTLLHEGITKLQDGRELETVRVIDGDPKDPNIDIWWYYFHPETSRIVAYRAKTSGHYSQVYNLDWDTSTEILFPSSRESYRVDSLGNHLYLRATYAYRKYSIIN